MSQHTNKPPCNSDIFLYFFPFKLKIGFFVSIL